MRTTPYNVKRVRFTTLTLIGGLALVLGGSVALAQLAQNTPAKENTGSEPGVPIQSVLADGDSIIETETEQITEDAQRKTEEKQKAAEGDSPEALPPIPRPSETASERRVPARKLPGELGIRVENTVDGISVCGVILGSAGDKAGIRLRDRIVGLNGEEVRTTEEFTQELNTMFAGDVCEIDVVRNGLTSTIAAELEPAGYVRRQLVHRWSDYEPTYSHYYYRPRYLGPRYYRTSRFGYYDYGWYRGGGVHIGPLHIHW